MKYLRTIIVVIILIILTVIAVIFMPKSKCYFDWNIYPELSILLDEENFKIIKRELITTDNSDVFLFYYDGRLHNLSYANFPHTYNLLRCIPDIKNIFISILSPRTKTSLHQGSDNFANDTLRCILPIEVSGNLKSGINTDGENKLFKQAEWIILDYSRPNYVFNKHKKNKTRLLILDLYRPHNIPRGISQKPTEQLL